MLQNYPYLILASADTGALGVLLAACFVIALAAEIGTAVSHLFFGLIKIGIGLVVLSIVAGIIAILAAIGN